MLQYLMLYYLMLYYFKVRLCDNAQVVAALVPVTLVIIARFSVAVF